MDYVYGVGIPLVRIFDDELVVDTFKKPMVEEVLADIHLHIEVTGHDEQGLLVMI